MSEQQSIVACVDGSAYAAAACDAAIWAATQLDAPLAFVNVISRRKHAAAADYSGEIGLGTREHLLTELTELDNQRANLARERGRDFLASAQRRALDAGRPMPTHCQRNGELVDALHHLGDDIRLLALGKRGESAGNSAHLGSNLERVIRSVACPVLVTNDHFTPPTRMLIAFDGSRTGQHMIERAIATPLLTTGEVHLVHVGQPDDTHRAQINAAADKLRSAGASLHTAIIDDEVEPALHAYQHEHGLDLMIMGAFGHTRIRKMLLGSTTMDMIRRADVPLLIVR